MGSSERCAQHEHRAPWWVPWLAVGTPVVWYVATASPSSYWLDSGEFAAASIDLDIPHPPGHPLACLWGKLFTLLPVGPLPFRMALGQLTAAAITLALLYVALERSLTFLGLAQRLPRALLVCGAVWTLAGSYGYWFQSVRAEVYALQAMLVAIALERLTRLATWSSPPHDARPFYAATLALGIGLANHHLVAFLAIPALLFALVVLAREQGVRPVLIGLATGLLGLAHYLYLPLRARTLPPMDLGHPDSLQRMFWVVSAQVYARDYGGEALQPMGERFADLIVILVDNLFAPTLLFALLGLYTLFRARRTWHLGFVLAAFALVNLCGRAWLGPVRANPDMLGYMMPGFAGLIALAACGLGALLSAVPSRGLGPLAQCAACALPCALGIVQLAHGGPRSSLAEFRATDVFDDLRRRALPQNAVVVAVTPSVAFRHWDGEAVERLRPDVTLLPVPFLAYPGTGDALATKHPALAPIVRRYLSTKQLPLDELVALSRTRPVLIEADTSVALHAYALLEPEGLFYRLRDRPVTQDEVRAGALERAALWARFEQQLGADRNEPETRAQLLWLHYVDSLYYAFHGLIDLARASAALGLAIEPEAAELVALAGALAHAPARRFDIRPYLVGR